jgi:hypothetical protein
MHAADLDDTRTPRIFYSSALRAPELIVTEEADGLGNPDPPEVRSHECGSAIRCNTERRPLIS